MMSAPGFEEIAAQYRAAREGAGLVDRSDLGVVEVTGRDRQAFLHAMLSNDIKRLTAGQGCRAAFLDVHGKVQALLTVWVLEDRVLLVTPPGLAAKIVETLDRYLFSEKATLRDASGEIALLMLVGPQAPSLIARVAGAPVLATAWGQATATLAGASVRLVRGDGESGSDEVWVGAPPGDLPAVRQALLAAGAQPIGPAAWESLRVEAGTPVYGADVDGSVLLPEIPVEPWVSYTKGCYLGQEVVVRIRDRGHVNRHLRGLLVDSDTVPAPGSPVEAGGADVGRVTSAAWSYALGRPLALAFIRRQHAAPGTRLEIRAGELALPATVSDLPFTR